MRLLAVLISLLAALPCSAGQEPAKKWCPPDGPRLADLLAADHPLMLRPGWVTLRMRVRPGAVPVSDVRVVSEAGGPSHAREWLPLVRQWVGCASNEQDAVLEQRFNFSYQGAYHLPAKEGFGLYAFMRPAGAPRLPENDWGIGICPIKATLRLLQPAQPNVVVELESEGGAPVREWLQGLVPDRDYMAPSPQSNRVEFGCKVDGGKVVFYEL